MTTHVDCAGPGRSPVLSDLHLQVILLGIFLVVENSQQVNNAGAMINRELVGLRARLRRQFVRQRIALVRQRLYLNHTITHAHISNVSGQ